jgi:aryl-alcohol dehydrogenase-like predicted oxidoreductase
MDYRRLGRTGPEVSALSLGSWRTFERMPREQGAEVMRAARDAGITFLDDARYDDETGSAPLRTGYSEVVFGELFRAAGWARDRVVVANKLWWEFWPGEGAVAELAGSLTRMGLQHVDLIYAERPPSGARVEDLLADVAAVLDRGMARHWGLLNWSAELTERCLDVCDRIGLAYPVATQLPYSLVRRSIVEAEPMRAALGRGGVDVVASSVLHGGALSGKYGDPAAAGRLAGRLGSPGMGAVLDQAAALGRFATERGLSPASVAVAFALASPTVGSVLFGAMQPRQIAQNVAGIAARRQIRDDDWAQLLAMFPA